MRLARPAKAVVALKWAVREMEERYKTLAAEGVRNIEQYNRNIHNALAEAKGDEANEIPKPLPFIVVVIDELADLMMVAGNEVEQSIARLAQMARAVGMHLVLATQRPSVDVITGLIKANFPARISFRVATRVDSRTSMPRARRESRAAARSGSGNAARMVSPASISTMRRSASGMRSRNRSSPVTPRCTVPCMSCSAISSDERYATSTSGRTVTGGGSACGAGVAWTAAAVGGVIANWTGKPPRAPMEGVRMAKKKMWVRHDKAAAELIVAKHRAGPTGVARLVFRGQYTKFGNAARGV